MDKERKSRGRNGAGISLRMQFGILFFLMMIGTILLGYLINGLFLEEYYVSVRTSDLVRVYDMLLPAEKDEEGEEIDPREELVRQLLEYKTYKYMSFELREREHSSQGVWVRRQSIPRQVQQAYLSK